MTALSALGSCAAVDAKGQEPVACSTSSRPDRDHPQPHAAFLIIFSWDKAAFAPVSKYRMPLGPPRPPSRLLSALASRDATASRAASPGICGARYNPGMNTSPHRPATSPSSAARTSANPPDHALVGSKVASSRRGRRPPAIACFGIATFRKPSCAGRYTRPASRPGHVHRIAMPR